MKTSRLNRNKKRKETWGKKKGVVVVKGAVRI